MAFKTTTIFCSYTYLSNLILFSPSPLCPLHTPISLPNLPFPSNYDFQSLLTTSFFLITRDAIAGGLHADDGVSRVDQVMVLVADKLPELLLLVLNLLSSQCLYLSDLNDGLQAEDELNVMVSKGGDVVFIGI